MQKVKKKVKLKPVPVWAYRDRKTGQDVCLTPDTEPSFLARGHFSDISWPRKYMDAKDFERLTGHRLGMNEIIHLRMYFRLCGGTAKRAVSISTAHGNSIRVGTREILWLCSFGFRRYCGKPFARLGRKPRSTDFFVGVPTILGHWKYK